MRQGPLSQAIMFDCNNKNNKKQVKEAVSNMQSELASPCNQGMYFLFLSLVKRSEVKITQSRLTLRSPMHYIVEGILQARRLE